MEIIVLQEELQKVINIASHFISPRPQISILSNILLNAEKGQLRITATNLETGINIKTGADVKKSGKTTVNFRTLFGVISTLSRGRLELIEEDGSLILNSNSSSIKLPTTPHNDFPNIPSELPKNKTTLPLTIFRDVEHQVVFATGNDSTKQEFGGVLFLPKRGYFEIVATDGVRLSKKKVFESVGIGEKLLIPSMVLSEIPKIFTDKNLDFSINEQENQVIFGDNKLLLVARLINGEYPDFEKIIPSSWTTKIIVDKEDLLKAIGLASVFAEDYKIKLSIQKKSIVVSSSNSQLGSQTSTLPAKLEGDEMVIAFNWRFLKEFLNAANNNEIIIELTNPIAPAVFRDGQDETFLHLIMPIIVQAE